MIYLIFILGTILRFISLNQSLWLDEATTALVMNMSLPDFFNKFIINDFHPPLYYLVIHYWSNLFGTSEIMLRIPSVIFGVLTIYFLYLAVKESISLKIVKLKWPILPSLLLATSGLHIYYSQEARMYSMATFLVTLIIYLYLKRKWILLSIFLPVLFLTDYLSMLILPVLVVYTLFYNRIALKKIILSSIPLFLTVIFWLPFFLKQITSGIGVKVNSNAWWNILGSVSAKNILLIPVKFVIGRVTIDNKFIYLSLIFLLLLIVCYFISKAKNKFAWIWLGTPLILGIIISFFIPTLTYFRYLFILPAFYLLLSESLNKTFVLVLLVLNLITTGTYLFNPAFQREDWRSLSKLIGNEAIVFPSNSQKEALIYYGKENNIITKEMIKKDQSTVWLSRYVWDIFDPSDSTSKYIEGLGYNKVAEANFNGVVLYKYENRN